MMTECKACGAEIEFIKTKTGKFMPVNNKQVTIVTADGEVHRGKIPHWSTCPLADNFKRRK